MGFTTATLLLLGILPSLGAVGGAPSGSGSSSDSRMSQSFGDASGAHFDSVGGGDMFPDHMREGSNEEQDREDTTSLKSKSKKASDNKLDDALTDIFGSGSNGQGADSASSTGSSPGAGADTTSGPGSTGTSSSTTPAPASTGSSGQSSSSSSDWHVGEAWPMMLDHIDGFVLTGWEDGLYWLDHVDGDLAWNSNFGCGQIWKSMAPLISDGNGGYSTLTNGEVSEAMTKQAMLWYRLGERARAKGCKKKANYYLGLIVRMVQSSFSLAHTVRAKPAGSASSSSSPSIASRVAALVGKGKGKKGDGGGGGVGGGGGGGGEARCGAILQFQSYQLQDSKLHSIADKKPSAKGKFLKQARTTAWGCASKATSIIARAFESKVSASVFKSLLTKIFKVESRRENVASGGTISAFAPGSTITDDASAHHHHHSHSHSHKHKHSHKQHRKQRQQQRQHHQKHHRKLLELQSTSATTTTTDSNYHHAGWKHPISFADARSTAHHSHSHTHTQAKSLKSHTHHHDPLVNVVLFDSPPVIVSPVVTIPFDFTPALVYEDGWTYTYSSYTTMEVVRPKSLDVFDLCAPTEGPKTQALLSDWRKILKSGIDQC